MSKAKTIPAPTSSNERTSVSVEKISNGYLVRTSTSDGRGWREKTEYSATKPKATVQITASKRGGK